MLVLVSFGLVLLATILLIVGLLSDDGLTLIYFSIASSFAAAVVLALAFWLSRPKGEPAAGEPEALDTDLVPTGSDVTAVTPAVAPTAPTAPAEPAKAPEPVLEAPEPEPQPEPEPEPVITATGAATSDDDWVHDDDWAADEGWTEAGEFEVEFPIADYDELTVSEIMPLLPQLYSDELEIVAERERAGKNRSTILNRLAELAETGTEADRLEEEADEAAAEPDVAVAAGSPAPTPAPAAPRAPEISFHDADDELDYVFPIADYDELTVAQIMPLLPQLELDELEEVKEREVAGQARKSLITEIDRYLSGELELAGWDEETDQVTPAPSAPAAPAPTAAEPTPAQPVAAEASPAEAPAARLAIADYDRLNVADIRPQLSDLSDDQLEAVRGHEAARDNRKTIIDEIDRRLSSSTTAAAEKPATKKPAGTKRTTKKRAAKRPAAKKPATRKSATKKRTGKKAATKKRATKKKASANSRFPIARYDELTVAQIRPRLSDLSNGQLQQVPRARAQRPGPQDDPQGHRQPPLDLRNWQPRP